MSYTTDKLYSKANEVFILLPQQELKLANDFDACEFVCRGQHQHQGWKPYIGYWGPVDKSMARLWDDDSNERKWAVHIFSDFLNCYADSLLDHPENQRPGMQTMYRKLREKEQKAAEERERKLQADIDESLREELDQPAEKGGVWVVSDEENMEQSAHASSAPASPQPIFPDWDENAPEDEE